MGIRRKGNPNKEVSPIGAASDKGVQRRRRGRLAPAGASAVFDSEHGGCESLAHAAQGVRGAAPVEPV